MSLSALFLFIPVAFRVFRVPPITKSLWPRMSEVTSRDTGPRYLLLGTLPGGRRTRKIFWKINAAQRRTAVFFVEHDSDLGRL